MAKFRKKPVVIEAVQTKERVVISTLEGDMVAEPGDWIITGVKGEKYPCKPDIFEATYEPVSEDELASEPEGLEKYEMMWAKAPEMLELLKYFAGMEVDITLIKETMYSGKPFSTSEYKTMHYLLGFMASAGKLIKKIEEG